MSQMWDNEIMAETLKHIFRKHIRLDGDNNWGLNSHDSEKVKRRVYPTTSHGLFLGVEEKRSRINDQ